MLLTLLRLNMGGVRLNPALPTFYSPTMLGMLMSAFNVTKGKAMRRSVGGCVKWRRRLLDWKEVYGAQKGGRGVDFRIWGTLYGGALSDITGYLVF